MTHSTLVLFPDTNLFIECKPLDQLDWSEWREFTEIHLMICRPVTREIDDLKTRGNSRAARRARAAYKIFGPVAVGKQEFLAINDSAPIVKLFLEPLSRTSPELESELDYSKSDDQIVGCLHRFRQENREVDARLLTYDRGPMMAARAFGLPVEVINETWLMQPEHNELETENARLKERISQLEKAEPKFKIELVDEDGVPLDQLTIEQCIFEPLTPDDIEALVDSLTDRYPMATKFGPLESTEDLKDLTAREWLDRKSATGLPKDEDIAQYTKHDYPNWVRQCRQILSTAHENFQSEAGPPVFEFTITNEGTRPGNDALIVIEAEGNFTICPPPYKAEFDADTKEKLALPRPPRPPRGPQATGSLETALGGIHGVAEKVNLLQRLANPLETVPFVLPSSLLPNDNRRDPNGVYYKPSRPSEPRTSFVLECEQWRHGIGSESFVGEIFFGTEQTEIRGLLRCEVHAENLSTPTSEQIPVRITIKRVSSQDRAKELVQKPTLLGI